MPAQRLTVVFLMFCEMAKPLLNGQAGCLEFRVLGLGFWVKTLGCGHGIGCSLVWDTPRPLASVRSSQPTP